MRRTVCSARKVDAVFEATISLKAGASAEGIIRRRRHHVAVNAKRLGNRHSHRTKKAKCRSAYTTPIPAIVSGENVLGAAQLPTGANLAYPLFVSYYDTGKPSIVLSARSVLD